MNLNCKCGESIIKSTNGEAKMRSKLIVWNPKGMFAICKGCGDEVKVDTDLLKSIEATFRYEIEADKK